MNAFSILLCSLITAAAFPLATQAAAAQQAATSAATTDEPVVAVGAKRITTAEFEVAVRQAMRSKFYHGQVPDQQVIELQRDVANQIVDRALLVEEAKRRGMHANNETIRQVVSGYDQRYADSARWKTNRARMLERVVPELEQRDMLDQLERLVRTVPEPSEREARAFYDSKAELFTEPEKLRVSVILLGVDPASSKATWDTAQEEARAIYKRLKAGAQFAELARVHSVDESSARGGDMGYVHRGMMPEALQQQIDNYAVGEIQEPVVTLRGVALFRVDEKTAPRLRPFDQVKLRAADLLQRDRADTAWRKLIEKLREEARFFIREERFPEIAARLK